MKRPLFLLALQLCALPLLHGQAEISAPPVEIKPPGTTQATPNESHSTSAGMAHRNRRDKRSERRQPSSQESSVSGIRPALVELDANRDGKVDLAEYLDFQRKLAEQRGRASFQEQDRNHDGLLTAEELSAPQPSDPRPRRPFLRNKTETRTQAQEEAPKPLPPTEADTLEITPPPVKL